MKQKLILAALILLSFSLFNKVIAQDQQQTPPANVSVSPSFTYVDKNALGQNFEITVKNTSDKKISIMPVEKSVTIKDGKTIPSSEAVKNSLLEFKAGPFDVDPNTEVKFPVRVKLSVGKISGIFPAVSFTASSGEGNLSVSGELFSVFLIQDFEGSLSADVNVSLTTGTVTVDRNFNINGTVVNNGEKFYNPSGTVTIFKGDQKLYEQQITSDIQGELFPNESKNFMIKWQNELSGLSSIGSYTIQTKITPAPFSQTFVAKVQIFYFPSDLILLVIPVIAVLAIIFVIAKNLRRKAQNA
jgi:hypothetical protein